MSDLVEHFKSSETEKEMTSLAQHLFSPFDLVHSILVTSALTLLQFPEFHPAKTSLTLAAQGLLTNSALTSVAFLIGMAFLRQKSTVLSKIRRASTAQIEQFENRWRWSATLIVTVMHNLALWEFIVALLLWYCDQANFWRRCLTGVAFGVLVLMAAWALVREAYHEIQDLADWLRRKRSDRQGRKRSRAESVSSQAANAETA